MSEYPLGPRLLAGFGALATGLYFGAATPATLLARGYPLTAWALVAVTAPLVALLIAVALFPGTAQIGLRRVSRIDLRDPGHVAALIVISGTMFFVLGYGSIVNGVYAYEHEILKGIAEPLTADDIFTGLILNVLILVLPPLFYVSFTSDKGPARALEALGLRTQGAGRAMAIGAAAAFAVLVLIGIFSYAVSGLNVTVPENERALEIARSVTVLGALGLALGSSVSEEIFFRGFLQARVGYVGQAVLFALAHLSYLNVLEIVVVFVLALVFGAIYRATGNLWAPIAGHFTFNLLMLLAGIYAPQAGT